MTALAERTEVLELGQMSLRELADEANREGRLFVEAATSMVEHFLRMGDALLQAQQQLEQQAGKGHWLRWVDENYEFHQTWASRAMRGARNKEKVRASGVTTISGMCRFLTAIEAPSTWDALGRHPQWKKDEAIRLRADGVSVNEIARNLEVSKNAVRWWIADPDTVKRRREYDSRRSKRNIAAARALKQQQQDKAIKQAVKKRGAAMAEAWAMAERMQDVLAQAQHETQDREAREALSRAGVHYRQMRDQIVRALGVA